MKICRIHFAAGGRKYQFLHKEDAGRFHRSALINAPVGVNGQAVLTSLFLFASDDTVRTH